MRPSVEAEGIEFILRFRDEASDAIGLAETSYQRLVSAMQSVIATERAFGNAVSESVSMVSKALSKNQTPFASPLTMSPDYIAMLSAFEQAANRWYGTISARLTSFAAIASRAGLSTDWLASRWNELKTIGSRLLPSLGRVVQALREFAELKFENIQTKGLQKLLIDLQRVARVFAQWLATFPRIREEMKKTHPMMKEQADDLNAVASAAQKAGFHHSDAGNAARRSAEDAKKSKKPWDDLLGTFNKLGALKLAGGLGLGLASGAAFNKFTDSYSTIEQAALQVKTKMGDAVGSMDQLISKFRDLGGEAGFAARDVGSAYAEITRNTGKVDEFTDKLSVKAVQIAKIHRMSVESVGNLAGTIMRNLQISGKDMDVLFDKAHMAAKKNAMSMDEFLSMLSENTETFQRIANITGESLTAVAQKHSSAIMSMMGALKQAAGNPQDAMKAMKGMTDLVSEEGKQMLRIFTFSEKQYAELQEDMLKGRMDRVYTAVIEGSRHMIQMQQQGTAEQRLFINNQLAMLEQATGISQDMVQQFARVNLDTFKKTNAMLDDQKAIRKGFLDDLTRYKGTWDGMWEDLRSVIDLFTSTAGQWIKNILGPIIHLFGSLARAAKDIPMVREAVAGLMLISAAVVGIGGFAMATRGLGSLLKGFGGLGGIIKGLLSPMTWLFDKLRAIVGLGPKAAEAASAASRAASAASAASKATEAAAAAAKATEAASLGARVGRSIPGTWASGTAAAEAGAVSKTTGILARLRGLVSAGLSKIFGSELIAGIGSKFGALLARFPVLSIVGKVASRFLGWVGIALLAKDLMDLLGWVDKVTASWPMLNRAIMSAFGPLGMAVKGVKALKDAWANFKEFLTGPLTTSEVGKWVEAVKFMFGDVKTWVVDILDSVSKWWDGLMTSMSNKFHDFLKSLKLGWLSDKIKEASAPKPVEKPKSWSEKFWGWDPIKSAGEWRDKYLTEKRGQAPATTPATASMPVPEAPETRPTTATAVLPDVAPPVTVTPREDQHSEFFRSLQKGVAELKPKADIPKAAQPIDPTQQAMLDEAKKTNELLAGMNQSRSSLWSSLKSVFTTQVTPKTQPPQARTPEQQNIVNAQEQMTDWSGLKPLPAPQAQPAQAKAVEPPKKSDQSPTPSRELAGVDWKPQNVKDWFAEATAGLKQRPFITQDSELAKAISGLGNETQMAAIKPATPPEKTISGPGEFSVDTTASMSQNETKKQDYDLMAKTAKEGGKPVVYNNVDLNQEEVVKELQSTNLLLTRMLEKMANPRNAMPVDASFHGRFGVLAQGMA